METVVGGLVTCLMALSFKALDSNINELKLFLKKYIVRSLVASIVNSGQLQSFAAVRECAYDVNMEIPDCTSQAGPACWLGSGRLI